MTFSIVDATCKLTGNFAAVAPRSLQEMDEWSGEGSWKLELTLFSIDTDGNWWWRSHWEILERGSIDRVRADYPSVNIQLGGQRYNFQRCPNALLTDQTIVFHGGHSAMMQLTVENESPELHSRHQKGIIHIALEINTQSSIDTIDLFQLRKMSKKDVVDLTEELNERMRNSTNRLGRWSSVFHLPSTAHSWTLRWFVV